MRNTTNRLHPGWNRHLTVRYVNSMFIYLVFVFLPMLFFLLSPPYMSAEKIIPLVFILPGAFYIKDAGYLFGTYPVILFRYIIISMYVLLAVAYLVFIHEPELFPLSFALFVFGGTLFILLLYWFSRAFTAKVYIDVHRRIKLRDKREREYYASLNKHNKLLR